MIDIYWLRQAIADVPADDDWLTAIERQRLAGLRFAKRRADWRLGRWTAKRALTLCCASDPLELEIRAAPDGAPEVLYDNRPAEVTISLSHSNGTALSVV